ncbi:hypothetical protein EW026_g1971 [Hermanssonia centrifuga]|uniref:DH domain-containing protein n=1 Tax=Hermanssonia centrifuga TaxID=98765 RepID=A0A4S4KPU6_9APHY|nr:hypothetical protein EW026_g1971 [Hermanssonia centrifuga]
MKPQPGLKKQISRESLGDLVEPGTLWIHSVPQAIVDSVSDAEKRRQEAINEVIYTERDFVRDMEYLRDLWIKPLRESDIIPEPRRTQFLDQVFWNIHDIIAVNTRLRDALNKRQKSYAVVEQIGDILLDAVPHFGPFVSYGAHQLYGKYEFEKEKSSNPAFAQFVEETERRPESRKLELNGYLTKPTTRLARPDKTELPKVVEIVKGFLNEVNTETGKAENRFNLLQLHQQLVFRQGEEVVDLRLPEEGRELVYKGPLKKRGGSQGDSAELIVFLFDHALLMVKQKSKLEQYKVYRRPIPLELLLVSAPDEYPTAKPANARQKALLLKNMPHAPVIPVKESKGGFSITFVHLGRKYYQMTLWASTYVGQRKWVEHILKQQEIMRDRCQIFETVTLSEGFFVGPNRINCAAPFDQGRRAVYGTADGVYLSNLWENREPTKVLALLDVTQIDVLEDYQLLIVLSEGQVLTVPLEALDPRDPLAALRRAKRIASHISFFKAGVCLEFAFYVNKTGWRSRKDFMVYWEGVPTGFALQFPYVLAFEPTFVEIRHVQTGAMSQIIQGNNLRCLFADTPPSTTNSAAGAQFNPYQQAYPQSANPYARQSMQSVQSLQSSHNGYAAQYSNPYQPRPTTYGREEILMVSDDRIMRLQMRIPSLPQ